jgi:hypothetical protein
MELFPSLQKHFPAFLMFRIENAAVHRADLGTSRLTEGTNAFGAPVRVDHIDDLPFADGLIRALRLAGPATDAFVCYLVGQTSPPSQSTEAIESY